MNIEKFDVLTGAAIPARYLLRQDMAEWRTYLEFVSGYFAARMIEHPTVVEIGVMFNAQKPFYTDLMGALHIGVDCNPNACPDILGDSHDPQTVDVLRERLAGRQVDLLFIDGGHSYESVKRDYELFAPLAKHLVAFHDVFAQVHSEVWRFWQELTSNDGTMSVLFGRHNAAASPADNRYVDMGIGVVIKG